MDRLKRCIILSGIVVAWLSAGSMVRAAGGTIVFSNQTAVVRPGDLSSVDVLLTSLDQTINAVDLTISYPSDRLQIVDVSRAQSALVFWPEAPRWDNTKGTLHIVGGTPNGLYAKDARLVTITLSAVQSGSAALLLDTSNSAVYYNDGVGTKAVLPPAATTLTIDNDFLPSIHIISTSHPQLNTWSSNTTVQLTWDRVADTQYSYSFGVDGQQLPDDQPDDLPAVLTYHDLTDGRYAFTIKSWTPDGGWSAVTQRWFLIDHTPPETFTIQQLSPQTVGGQQVIAWAVQDAMSGATSMLRVDNQAGISVTSPLTLQPTWRGKKLHVTLTDQAGNTQSAVWYYGVVRRSPSIWWFVVSAIMLLIVVGAGLIFVRHRR